ncbi:MAG: hypothetical protein J7M38_11470 [Armatimonadetes bacterium]|nr:hypothetical protein [Armatimonadota bacterium]
MAVKRKELKWRKIGGGSLRYIRGRIIKPNEVFVAREDEIPIAFRRFVVPLPEGEASEEEGKKIEKREVEQRPRYEMHTDGNGWWDIINVASGKPINEKKLRKEEAEKVLKDLL